VAGIGDRERNGRDTPAGAPAAVLAGGSAGLIVHAVDGKVITANERAVELLGVTLKQLCAPMPRPPVWTFTDPDGEGVDPAELAPFAVASSGKVVPGGVVGIDDGSPSGRRWLRIDCEELHDEIGRVSSFVTTVLDVTGEHRARVASRAAGTLVARASAVGSVDLPGFLRETLATLGWACEAARVFCVDLDRPGGQAVLVDQWTELVDDWPHIDVMPIDMLAQLLRGLSRSHPVTVHDGRLLLGNHPLQEQLDALGLRSGVAAPITVGGRLEGFIGVTWDRPRTAPPEIADLVMLAGDLVAGARVAARLDLEVEELRRRLAARASSRSPDDDGDLDARRAALYVDVTPDIFLEIDGDNRLVSVTFPAAYTSEYLVDLQGTDVVEVFHGSDRERLVESLKAVRSGSPIEVFDFEWDTPEGRRCYEARFTSGGNGRVVSVIRETTASVERHRVAGERMQALTMANEELTRLVQERDQFLASVSHELRTPLNAILGLTEMLLDGNDEPLTAAQSSTLRTIESSGRHLLELINDLLDLSRLRARVMKLDLREVRLEEPCRLAFELIRPRAVARGVHVELVNPSGDLRVRVDERRLRQVLINLLDNAVKFTEPGGTAGLQVWQPDDEHVALSVWDTGSGIAPGDQARIFEPFKQIGGRRADGRRASDRGDVRGPERGPGGIDRRSGIDRRASFRGERRAGWGLGLSVVERLVSLHEGRIDVDSAPGRGSRFTVVLPLSGPDPDTGEVPQIPDVPPADS
jgi:signal transduction histidine kinase